MQASGLLEDVARLALVTATRASRLRLPCETYTPILDDDPLPQGTVSSSVMRVRRLGTFEISARNSRTACPARRRKPSNSVTCAASKVLSAEATWGCQPGTPHSLCKHCKVCFRSPFSSACAVASRSSSERCIGHACCGCKRVQGVWQMIDHSPTQALPKATVTTFACLQVTHSNSSRLPASPRRGARSGAGRDGQPPALMQELTSPGLLAAITARDGGSKTDIQVSCLQGQSHFVHRHGLDAPRSGTLVGVRRCIASSGCVTIFVDILYPPVHLFHPHLMLSLDLTLSNAQTVSVLSTDAAQCRMVTCTAQTLACGPVLILKTAAVEQVKNAMGDWTAVNLKENEVNVAHCYRPSLHL